MKMEGKMADVPLHCKVQGERKSAPRGRASTQLIRVQFMSRVVTKI